VKLLVAVVHGGSLVPLWEESQQTRLGQGFYETHFLRPDAIAATAQAVSRLVEIARTWKPLSVRVIATSAARDAANRSEFMTAIRSASGLEVEVISGEQEADWVFAGVRSDPALAEKSLLIMDVGGGSTELILGHGARKTFKQSFPMGTVRLLEKLPLADPPLTGDWEQCRAALDTFFEVQVQPVLQPHLASIRPDQLEFVGTGGTTSMLAAMQLGLTTFDREKMDRTILAFAEVQAFRTRLWSLGLAERKRLPGLPANRADVILFGVAIFEAIMEVFDFGRLRVSTRGLRFGAVAADPISA
jgi:exopolyphosphatase/guanosine-5'-triphosphate,3'-diphosphate pyrophosphatase